MPHQLGVTIRAEVTADQVAPLRDWLANGAQGGTADNLFGFGRMRGLHFAKLLLLEEAADPDGPAIPASLVLMTEVDAPLRSHLADLADVGADGIGHVVGFCAGYPGPDTRKRSCMTRSRISWIRRSGTADTLTTSGASFRRT